MSRDSDYTLCGWRVRSDWPLPELLSWAGDDRPADIHIGVGEVPPALDGVVSVGPLLQVNGQGQARFALDGVGAFLVEGGRRITISTPHGPDTPDIGLFLFGTVFGILCHQRGVLPLHASCVELEGKAFAFAGHSGAGKSTLAAALLAQGARLVADDLTVIEMRDGIPTVLPAFPRVKMWRDTLDAMGLRPGRRLRTTASLEKFEHSATAQFHDAPIRLAAIRHLTSVPPDSLPPETALAGSQGFVSLQRQIYRDRAARKMGLEHALFITTAAITAMVPQYRMATSRNLDLLLASVPALAGRLRRDAG